MAYAVHPGLISPAGALLRAGHTDFVLNEAAFDDMRGRGLSGPVMARLAEAGDRHFVDRKMSPAHLDRPGIVARSEGGLAVIQDLAQIATEGAQRGSVHATRRKVSAGPSFACSVARSDAGRDCRDAFLGLVKTCAKHGVAFWDYPGSRLSVPGQPLIPPLPQHVRCRSQPA